MGKLSTGGVHYIDRFVGLVPYIFGLRWFYVDRTPTRPRTVHLSQFGFFMGIVNAVLGIFCVYAIIKYKGLEASAVQHSEITKMGDVFFKGLSVLKIPICVVPTWVFVVQRRRFLQFAADVENKLGLIDKVSMDNFGWRIILHTGSLILVYAVVQYSKLYFMAELTAYRSRKLDFIACLRLLSLVIFLFGTVYDFTINLIYVGRRLDQVREVLKGLQSITNVQRE